MALAQSLNIPAVKVLDALGPGKLYGRLQQVGATPFCPRVPSRRSPLRSGAWGCGFRTWPCFTPVARGGEQVPLRWRRHAPARRPMRRRRGCCRRLLPGTSPIFCGMPPRPPTPGRDRSPTRREPPTVFVTPGRLATTAAIPSPFGSAGPTAPPPPAWPDALPPPPVVRRLRPLVAAPRPTRLGAARGAAAGRRRAADAAATLSGRGGFGHGSLPRSAGSDRLPRIGPNSPSTTSTAALSRSRPRVARCPGLAARRRAGRSGGRQTRCRACRQRSGVFTLTVIDAKGRDDRVTIRIK